MGRVRSSFRPSKKIQKQQNDIHVMLNTIEAVKMLALYVLRNQGWGPQVRSSGLARRELCSRYARVRYASMDRRPHYI